MNFFFKNSINAYFKLMPSYFISTFFALITDNFIYTLTKNIYGIFFSTLFSFILSQIVLYSLLTKLAKEKFRNKFKGFLVQILISIGTLIINLIILNLINYFEIKYSYNDFLDFKENSLIYTSLTKFIASGFGFLWTSLLTSKFTFSSK